MTNLLSLRALEEVEINDISLVDFIAVKGKNATFVAHTAGKYQRKAFRKAQVMNIHFPSLPTPYMH